MYRSLAEAVKDATKLGIPLSQLALEVESDDQGRPVGEIRDILHRALTVMKGAVERGMTGDLKSESVLHSSLIFKNATFSQNPCC